MDSPSAAETAAPTSDQPKMTREQMIGTLAGLALTLLLAALDQTIVGTAMPAIIAQLSGFDRYSWVSTSYLLTSTLAVPIFAKLSDIYGRKWFFLAGCLLFILTSALRGTSGQVNGIGLDGMNQLIVFRGLQGIGGGMIIGLIFAILGDMFSPLERARFQGLFAGVWGLASIFGPTAGGWITDHFSWRWTFYVNLPVGFLAIAVLYVSFPHLRPPGLKRQIDWAGVLSLTGCLVPLLLGLTWVSDYGWFGTRVLGLFAIAAVMLAVFIAAELRAAEPVLPLTLFADRAFALASLGGLLFGIAMFAVVVFLPLYMQAVLGVSATKSGSLLTPLMVSAVIGSMFTGQFVSKTGRYKILAIGGSLIMLAGALLMVTMDKTTPPSTVVLYMLAVGVGVGVLPPIYSMVVQHCAPPHQMGAATASAPFFRSIGSTLGAAIGGSVLLAIYHADFAKAVPAGLPERAVRAFDNPMLLPSIRPQLEAAFGRYPGGAEVLAKLMLAVKDSLMHGIRVVFIIGAVVSLVLLAVTVTLPEGEFKKRA